MSVARYNDKLTYVVLCSSSQYYEKHKQGFHWLKPIRSFAFPTQLLFTLSPAVSATWKRSLIRTDIPAGSHQAHFNQLHTDIKHVMLCRTNTLSAVFFHQGPFCFLLSLLQSRPPSSFLLPRDRAGGGDVLAAGPQGDHGVCSAVASEEGPTDNRCRCKWHFTSRLTRWPLGEVKAKLYILKVLTLYFVLLTL